jgi:hypothetical protein
MLEDRLLKLPKASLKCKGKGAITKRRKQKTFFQIAKHFYFHFDLSYFISAYLSHFLFKLSDLNCSKSAILSSTNHCRTLKTTEYYLGIY